MAYICEKPKGSCEHCIHYREDSDGRMCCYAEKESEKYHNYKSPVSLDLEYDHMGKIEKQIIDQSEQYIARAIMKVTNLEVDKDELVKALNYDRAQYEKGFRDGFEAAAEILEKLNDRLTILRQELATIRTLKTLGYDLKTQVIDWYMNEIHCCVANIKWEENNA